MFEPLQKGDKVGIVSPSSFVTYPERIEKGLEYIRSLGLVPVLGEYVFGQFRYMSGTAQERAQDLKKFYQDPEIKAIFITAGGGGSAHILEDVDYETIKHNPKPLIGFSDSTALQNAIYSQTGGVNLTGFTLHFDLKNGKVEKQVDQSLQDLLFGRGLMLASGTTVVDGCAEGDLVGGCMSVFCYLCGTKYFPDLRDKILVLEDIGERSYRMDLMLQQLRLTPNFGKLKGIVFGGFSNIEVRIPEDGTMDEIIDEFCKDLSIPVVKNFDYSHEDSRYVLPLGARVRLDASQRTLQLLK